MADVPAGEGGFELGRGYIQVDPDADTFEDKLRAEVEDTGLVVTVPVEPDTEGFKGKVDAAVSESNASITVPVEPDTADLKEKVDAAAAESKATVTVPIEPDSEGFREKVQAEVGDTGAKSVVQLEPDTAGFAEKADAEAAAAGEESGASFGEKFGQVAGNAPLFAGAKDNLERDAEVAGEDSGGSFGGRFRSMLGNLPLFPAGGVERDAEAAAEDSGVGFGERFKSLLSGVPLMAGVIPGLEEESARGGEESGAKFGENFRKVLLGDASLLEVALGAGFIAATALMASKFQSAMEMIVTQAGVARGALGGLETGVLDLAGKVGFSPDSLAESLYHVESTFQSVGINGSKALDLVKVAAEGARVGGADLVDVTNALDSVMVSHISGIHGYGQAMGALNAIVGSGDMKMQDLADAMGTGLMAVAKSYGQSIYEVGAALATFGDNNIRGAKAATDLRMAMQAILDPVATAGTALQHLGLTDTQLGDTMEHHGLAAALQEFVGRELEATKTPVADWGQYMTDIFGKKAGVGIGVLVDQLSRMQSKFPDIEKGAHDFGNAWQETQNTVSQRLHELAGSFEATLTRIGMELMPAIDGFLKFGQAVMSVASPVFAIFFSGLAESLKILFGPLRDVTIAVIGYTVAMKAAALASAAFDALNPFGWVALAVTGIVMLVGVVVKFHKQIIDALEDVINWVSQHWVLVSLLGGPFGAIIGIAVHFREDLLGIFHDIEKGWDSLFSGGGKGKSLFSDLDFITPIEHAFDSVKSFIVSSFDGWWKQHGEEIKQVWDQVWNAMKADVQAVWTDIKAIVAVAWPLIKNTIIDGMLELETAFKMGWDAMAAVLKIFWAGISSTVKSAWDIITGLFNIALDLITGQWGKAWTDLQTMVTQVWNNISGFFKTTWDAITALFTQELNNLVQYLKSSWNLMLSDLKSVWNDIYSFIQGWWHTFVAAVDNYVTGMRNSLLNEWHDIENDVKSVWDAISSWFQSWWHSLTSWVDSTLSTFRSDLSSKWQEIQSDAKTAWNALESIFKNPVNFLINTVYDNGIRRLWNDVVNAVGAKSLDLPAVQSLAGGGRITSGTGPTSDDVLARVSKGETVVSAAHSQILAPAFAAVGVPGWAAGGMPAAGGKGGAAPSSVIGKGLDIAKILLALTTDNKTAFVNDFEKLLGPNVGGGAAGAYATVMGAYPPKLISDLVGAAWNALTAAAAPKGGGGPPGTYSSANLTNLGKYMNAHGYSKAAAAGIAGCVAGESGGNPLSAGSGGRGLIGWTPASSLPDSAFIPGNPVLSFNRQLPLILKYNSGNWGQYIAPLNRIANPVAAADFYSQNFERPAVTDSDVRPSVAESVFAALGGNSGKATNTAKTMDEGGWLSPGRTMVTNNTGQPEQVIAPGQPSAQGGITVNFYGSQYPTPEQVAALKIELATAVGMSG